VTSVGTTTYEYDANGNMTWRGSENQFITWDAENMPATISGPTGTATFVYDGDGNRVIKTENNQSILYVNKYFEKNLTTGEEICYYYLGGRRIAFKKGDDLEYTHEDHLTGTSLTTDENGDEVATVKYFPFGECRSSIGNVNTDKLFTGQRLDDTGLYYYNARYYDAGIGRFISADTIVPDPFNPQSLNRYSYCLNNPLRYVDPSGFEEVPPVLAAIWAFGFLAGWAAPFKGATDYYSYTVANAILGAYNSGSDFSVNVRQTEYLKGQFITTTDIRVEKQRPITASLMPVSSSNSSFSAFNNSISGKQTYNSWDREFTTGRYARSTYNPHLGRMTEPYDGPSFQGAKTSEGYYGPEAMRIAAREEAMMSSHELEQAYKALDIGLFDVSAKAAKPIVQAIPFIDPNVLVMGAGVTAGCLFGAALPPVAILAIGSVWVGAHYFD